MPSPFISSYDFQNSVRDLSDAFQAVIQKDPVLTSLIQTTGVARNTKHEWLEDIVQPLSWTVGVAGRAIAGPSLPLITTL
jgi:hypothetical protein